tara:strand:+ start:4576 stop:6525 length:1950 start_codon:yes stop_codon:yes gene_type:complete
MAYSQDQKYKPSNVKYTSKDFVSIKSDLIEYTKAYFPDTYKDFNETSPGMMLIELTSYVGDVLSYYIDYNYKENILATATEKRNVVRLSEFLGYKVSPNTPSLARLRVTTDVGVDADGNPDYSSAPQNPINSGLQIQSNIDSNLKFETLGEIDFTVSGSPDVPSIGAPTSFNANGEATGYTLTRFVQAVSGETKTKSFTITSPTKFLELDLGEDNVIEVLNCVDSSNQRWYEVDYLAQDRILKETHYTQDGRGDAYNQDIVGGGVSTEVAIPFTLDYINTNKKFTTKIDPDDNTMKLQFGNGLNRLNISGSSGASLFSMIEQQGLNLSGVPSSVINASLNNLTTNNSLNLGETPSNTIMTITYRVGGGADSNAQAGELTKINNSDESITVTNDVPALGGTDGQTVDEIRENAKSFFASQLRCVTREDYQARILNLPAKFGNIAKCYVHRNDDIGTLKIYTLSYNQQRQLVQTPLLALNNLRLYVEQFRMINDSLDFGFQLQDDIFSGYIINFGVQFEVNYDRRFNSTDVKLETINVIKEFFKVGKMQFRQHINLGDLKYNILGLDGVIGIKTLKLIQDTSEIDNFPTSLNSKKFHFYKGDGTPSVNGTAGYGFQYNFENATVNDIVKPSVTPAVFELRDPDNDIYGRVV